MTWILAAGLVLIGGCGGSPDIEALKAEVLDLHQKFIDAHVEGDVEFLVHNMPDRFLSVSRGEVRQPNRESIREMFVGYLGRTEFTEYRDLEEPRVGISADGSMAWIVVRVKVAGQQTADDGTVHDLEFVCAWITVYERQDGQWIRQVDVSSFT